MIGNECIPYYEPGSRPTAHAEAAVTGKRFVDISDDIQSGPGLSSTGEGGNLVVSPASAEGTALGVASHDAALGTKVTVLLWGVVPVTADGALSAGDEVEVGSDGKATKHDTGRVVGRALADAADDTDAMILLYQAIQGPPGTPG